MGDLLPVTFLDRDFAAVFYCPVNGWRRQRHIKRHIIIFCRQRLQVGADFVAHIPVRRGAVGADNHHIHLPALHQVATGIVHNQMVRNAMGVHLPACQQGALIARAGLINPDMDRYARLNRVIHRRGRRAPIHRGQPARVAMGQDIHRLPRRFPGGNPADDLQPVHPDHPVALHVLITNLHGAGMGGTGSPGLGQRAQQIAHFVKRPAQVDRGWAGFVQLVPSRVEVGI